jgi:hypothetical protein
VSTEGCTSLGDKNVMLLHLLWASFLGHVKYLVLLAKNKKQTKKKTYEVVVIFLR